MDMGMGIENQKSKASKESKASEKTCIYDEICSKEKMCGDCAMDLYEQEKHEEWVENSKLDRKMDPQFR
jgi:hypothetical protein